MGKRSDKRVEFLSDLLSCAVEGGINHWAEVDHYEITPNVIAHIVDISDGYSDNDDYAECPRYEITIDTVAKGIAILTNTGKSYSLSGRDYWNQFLLSNRTNGDDGDYDADIADNILQAGIFGEVIYG